jgi:hypothetical protein
MISFIFLLIFELEVAFLLQVFVFILVLYQEEYFSIFLSIVVTLAFFFIVFILFIF